MKEIIKEEIKIEKRQENAHKGSFGRLLIIAGSESYPGAAALSTLSALKGGAGMVTLLSEKSVIDRIFPLIPEAIVEDRQDKKTLKNLLMKSTAVVIGPGLGSKKKKLVHYVLKNYKGPILLDADGINSLCGNINILKSTKGNVILTPHAGEMARLLKTDSEKINRDRENTALRFSKDSGAYLVLKGHQTIISSPDGEIYKDTLGTPALATAGSGDVLSGLLGAFLAMGDSPLSAAKKAVFLHSLSGVIAEKSLGEHSVLARDIIDTIPTVILSLKSE